MILHIFFSFKRSGFFQYFSLQIFTQFVPPNKTKTVNMVSTPKSMLTINYSENSFTIIENIETRHIGKFYYFFIHRGVIKNYINTNIDKRDMKTVKKV